MGKEIVAIKHKNEDGIEEWIQKKKYSMCIWSVQKVSERMEAMRLLCISSQSTTRTKRILNIMLPVKPMVMAAWTRINLRVWQRLMTTNLSCTMLTASKLIFLRLDPHRQFIMMWQH